MQPFDLVLTPGWQWHDHGNQTDRPMIWLDGLDIPTVRHFDAGFAERLGEKAHRETALPGDTIARYAHNLRPFRGSLADRRPADQPPFPEPYVEWRAAPAGHARSAEHEPHTGHAMEFFNPDDGGWIIPDIATHGRLLTRGTSNHYRG